MIVVDDVFSVTTDEDREKMMFWYKEIGYSLAQKHLSVVCGGAVIPSVRDVDSAA